MKTASLPASDTKPLEDTQMTIDKVIQMITEFIESNEKDFRKIGYLFALAQIHSLKKDITPDEMTKLKELRNRLVNIRE